MDAVDGFSVGRFARRDLVGGYTELLLDLHRKTYGEGPLVDKSPGAEAVGAAPLVLEFLPSAKFIFMKRRGIENVMSHLRRFPDLPFEGACHQWAQTMRRWLQVRHRLAPRWIEIDQRDLVDAPHTVGYRLSRHLGRGVPNQIADYITTHFPEKTRVGRYGDYAALKNSGWNEQERDIFREICGPLMAEFGYEIDLGGAASPARRRRIDLVGREPTNRWTLLHPNQWVRTDPQGLRLHPNKPGTPPPTLTLRDGIVPGEYRFDAELVVFDERCQQHTITVCIRGPHSAQRFSTKVAGGMASPVAWHVPAISVAELSDIEIVVALDDYAADASYSATQLVGALTVRDQALFEAGEAAKAPPLSFAEMSAVGGVSYIEQTRSADAVWGFSHVPKTAGSTLNASLEAHRAPYYYIYARSDATSDLSFKELEWEAVRKFADIQKSAPAHTRCRSFSGHLRRPHIDFIQAELPGTRFFTVLREPVARVVSDYRYCMTPNFWGHEKFAAEFPTITDYIRHPINQNRMSKYLAAKCDTAEMVIDSVLHGFEFIGIMELYDVSMSMIFRLMGLTHIPTQRVNETISTDRNAIELSDAMREEILARNAIDDALYRAVREILEPQCEAWRRHFATLSQPDTGPAR